jgi:hypothetical protein
MRTTPSKRRAAGFISYLLVLSTGGVLTFLMLYTYQRALNSQKVQSQVQLRVDYSEKEEAILRSIVAITPNRAIQAMQPESSTDNSIANPMRWQNIFAEALAMANARTSVSTEMVTALNVPNLKVGNIGDSTLDNPARIFTAATPLYPTEAGYVSAGLNRSYGAGYPVPLTCYDNTTSNRDALYPIISYSKFHGTLAQAGVGLPVADYPHFNLLKYPNINFGYALPGADFVAKRNWWAFSIDVADHDDNLTSIARSRRDFVLSIYEIPSQLSISASSFMSLGQYASGEAWQNVNIDGGMFVGKAAVEGTTALSSIASRRGMTLSSGTTIGGQSFASSPFTAGVREAYQITEGAFFPVSLASESGKAAFIPINRGADFFDRFAHTTENDVLSSTTWNNYTIGALQCAMRLDVTKTVSASNATPTKLRFGYMLNATTRATAMDITLSATDYPATLPAGYVKICDEGQSYNLSTLASGAAVDVAYGVSGGYTFRQGLSGTITFNNSTFGDPKVGTVKAGYWRPRSPFEVRTLASGQNCIAVYPERIPAFLARIGGAGPAINNSIVVNVDYSGTGLNNPAKKPFIPCTANDYGAILQEANDLTAFTKGFSFVTNLRLYIGDNFNVVPMAPRAGYTPLVTPSNPDGLYFPPCSIFAPEKRYGVEIDAPFVSLRGQIGSLASDTVANPVRPLDSKNMSGNAMNSNQITVNLSQIRDPSELPPIAMMNWLILLEERRKEFY